MNVHASIAAASCCAARWNRQLVLGGTRILRSSENSGASSAVTMATHRLVAETAVLDLLPKLNERRKPLASISRTNASSWRNEQPEWPPTITLSETGSDPRAAATAAAGRRAYLAVGAARRAGPPATAPKPPSRPAARPISRQASRVSGSQGAAPARRPRD